MQSNSWSWYCIFFTTFSDQVSFIREILLYLKYYYVGTYDVYKPQSDIMDVGSGAIDPSTKVNMHSVVV